MPEKLALFDFDGTLCKGDSILPYLLFAIRKGKAPVWQLFPALAGFLGQKMKLCSVEKAKELTLSFLSGRTEEEAAELARRFFQERLQPDFFPEGIAELQRLKQEGCRIWLVSASPDCYMKVAPEFLPVDGVLATRCEVKNGRYTGCIPLNCRGENKLAYLKPLLESKPEVVAAYGDSASDAPLLRLAKHPVSVGGKQKLLQLVPAARCVHWSVK